MKRKPVYNGDENIPYKKRNKNGKEEEGEGEGEGEEEEGEQNVLDTCRTDAACTSVIKTLPAEMILLIFSFCQCAEAVKLLQVCKEFYAYINPETNTMFWTELAKRYIPPTSKILTIDNIQWTVARVGWPRTCLVLSNSTRSRLPYKIIEVYTRIKNTTYLKQGYCKYLEMGTEVFDKEMKIIYGTKETTQGECKDGTFQGFVEQNYADGGYYKGMFRNGAANSYGEMFFAEKKSYFYKGEWKDDEYHGYGEFHAEGEYTYKGFHYKNKRSGYGTITYKDGRHYSGAWKDGYYDGFGKYTDKEGSSYEGRYKKGKREGDGKLTHFRGDKYIGKWENNRKHGDGIFLDKDGVTILSQVYKMGLLVSSEKIKNKTFR